MPLNCMGRREKRGPPFLSVCSFSSMQRVSLPSHYCVCAPVISTSSTPLLRARTIKKRAKQVRIHFPGTSNLKRLMCKIMSSVNVHDGGTERIKESFNNHAFGKWVVLQHCSSPELNGVLESFLCSKLFPLKFFSERTVL